MTEVVAYAQLRAIVERIERINAEIDDMNTGKRDVYAEAKANGFEPKIIREVIKLRKMDRDDRQERDAVLSLYLEALEG
jgi:uncharacterized protein (UPF0335 family)